MSNPDSSELKILCIYASPRAGGNTDAMMDAFVAGVESEGAKARKVYLRELVISPCLELYRCRKAGRCAIDDQMTPLYEELRYADVVALSTPVMFYGVSATAKAFIDRCQALWCVKYLLKQPLAPGRRGRAKGVLLSAGGSNGQKLFDGIRMTFKYFLDAIDADCWGELFIRGVDVLGDAKKHPAELVEARSMGARVVSESMAPPGESD